MKIFENFLILIIQSWTVSIVTLGIRNGRKNRKQYNNNIEVKFLCTNSVRYARGTLRPLFRGFICIYYYNIQLNLPFLLCPRFPGGRPVGVF